MTLTEPTLVRPPEADSDTESDPGKVAHIIRTEPPQTATGAILEARVMGTEVEALCGWKFVPQQDPEKLPLCQACREIHEMWGMMGANIDKTPGA